MIANLCAFLDYSGPSLNLNTLGPLWKFWISRSYSCYLLELIIVEERVSKLLSSNVTFEGSLDKITCKFLRECIVCNGIPSRDTFGGLILSPIYVDFCLYVSCSSDTFCLHLTALQLIFYVHHELGRLNALSVWGWIDFQT